jgi:hypothetical protein
MGMILQFHLPYVSDQALFEATLEPTVPVLAKLAREIDVGESEIEVAGKKARVAVGVPYYENLVSKLSAEKAELPHEISVMLGDYDFHFASLSCSFQPDPDCRLVWARFGVELNAVSGSGEHLGEKPIAYDVKPEEVLSEFKCAREVDLGADVKVNLGPASAGVDLSRAKKTEFVFYEPQIFGYGIRRSNVGWNFRSTEEKGIWGNKKDLILIIRAPKNSKVKGKFLLGAEAEFKTKKLFRLPFARSQREEEAVRIEYDLSK